MKHKLITASIISVLALGAAQAGAHGAGDGHHHAKHKVHDQHERYAARYDRSRYGSTNYGSTNYGSTSYGSTGHDSSLARVVSVEPIYRTYSRPVSDHSCLRQNPGTLRGVNYTGPILGAIIGGALGHRIGDAHGDPQVAAVAGGLLGASIGHSIGRNVAYNRSVQVDGPCRVREHTEQVRELVEYRVGYRYNGQVQYASMDYDPGTWVKLDVNVAPV